MPHQTARRHLGYCGGENCMKKDWLKENSALLFVLIGCVILIGTSIGIFSYMDKSIDSLNTATMQNVGNTYLASMSEQISGHGKTYLQDKFNTLNALLRVSLTQEDGTATKAYLRQNLPGDFTYLALYKDTGETETLIGNGSYRPYDEDAFYETLETGENKVILTTNSQNERLLAFILEEEFVLDGVTYNAMLCGFPPEILNTVLNLSYSDNMLYSYVIRKEDSGFVIRNEDAFRETYFDRIKKLYQDYNGMTADDYIEQFSAAMERDEIYTAELMADGGRRIMYAEPFDYSDWYLVTFMRYTELDNLLGENNTKRNQVFYSCVLLFCVVFALVFSIYIFISLKQIKTLRELEAAAASANKAKSDFLSNMSHDLRTPMNAIVGMTEIARSHINDRSKTEECLKKISRASSHLLSLINDVLDMSKIESGKMSLAVSQMSLRDSMDNIVMIIQPQIKSKRQNFDVYIKDIVTEDVCCDNLRFNQVLINLLSNAVKYTQEEGNISLTLTQEASPLGDDYIRNNIIVQDDGIGMTKEFAPHVFDAFAREEKTSVRKEQGTGLGLAITKRIVELMAGTIEVKTKPMEGTSFHVTLDLKKGTLDENHMRFDGLRALVVDDDEELCKSTQQALFEIGVESEYVTHGKLAIEKVQDKSCHFDLILIDWQMPGLNGVETARRIREHIEDSVPMILISAYDWADFESEARSAGVTGFLSKPLFKSTLFFGIHQHISGGSSEPQKQPEDNIQFHGERILLAEDNELNGEIAIEILTEAGLVVDWVENGQLCVETFQAAPKGHYDAILMDIRMPVMTGYDATLAIRKLDTEIPIIAMTADAFAEDVARAIECGMNAHIAKPLDITTLFYTLHNWTTHKTET